MSKAQLHAQVLVYILSIIVLGIILAFGYKMIRDMQENNEEAIFIRFRQNVIASISDMEYDYGSRRKETFKTPSGIQEVCFVDLDEKPDTPYDVIDDSIHQVKKNVFLCPPCTHSFYAGNITSDSGYVCLSVTSGRITVWLEGLGRQVKVSE